MLLLYNFAIFHLLAVKNHRINPRKMLSLLTPITHLKIDFKISSKNKLHTWMNQGGKSMV